MCLPEQRVCSKCGAVRGAAEARCPACGTRRSRRLKRKRISFWKLPLAERKRLAEAMYEAITEGLREEAAARRFYIDRELPYFREFRRYYRMLNWSRICDGDELIDRGWYKQKPDKKVNPFTGLLWPPRDL